MSAMKSFFFLPTTSVALRGHATCPDPSSSIRRLGTPSIGPSSSMVPPRCGPPIDPKPQPRPRLGTKGQEGGKRNVPKGRTAKTDGP